MFRGLTFEKNNNKTRQREQHSKQDQKMRSSQEVFPPKPENHPILMIPEAIQGGSWVDYEGYGCRTQKIQWVSIEKNAKGLPNRIRKPREKTRKYRYPGSFIAAGKQYDSLNQLYAVDSGDHMRYKDIYGRHIFYDAELFPCFDSSDFMYENRFYRWFFILENGVMTRVYRTDEQDWIHVTEDVGYIEHARWDQMLRYDFFGWKG